MASRSVSGCLAPNFRATENGIARIQRLVAETHCRARESLMKRELENDGNHEEKLQYSASCRESLYRF